MKIRSLSAVSFCLLLMVSLSWEVGAYDEVHLKKLEALGSCPVQRQRFWDTLRCFGKGGILVHRSDRRERR